MSEPPVTPADPISPAEFLSSAPKGVGGNTPWAAGYGAQIRRAWLEHAAEDARTVQKHLGPSELGVECDRQVAGKMAGLPATNHVVDPWPSIRGRALHRMGEDVFSSDNLRRGLLRWVVEQRVTPMLEHPGTADLYDAVERAVVDHKFLGESSMSKVRKDPPRKYRVQLLLYGLGYRLLGLPVKRIVIAAYPATAASLDGLYVWEHVFSDEHDNLMPDVAALLLQVFEETEKRKALAEQITTGALGFLDVTPTPDSDECFFCPFYRPQAAKDSGPGCPGSVAVHAAY